MKCTVKWFHVCFVILDLIEENGRSKSTDGRKFPKKGKMTEVEEPCDVGRRAGVIWLVGTSRWHEVEFKMLIWQEDPSDTSKIKLNIPLISK